MHTRRESLFLWIDTHFPGGRARIRTLEEPRVERVPRGRGIFRRFRRGSDAPDTDDVSPEQPAVPADESPSEPEEQDSIVVLREEPSDRPDDVNKDLEDES